MTSKTSKKDRIQFPSPLQSKNQDWQGFRSRQSFDFELAAVVAAVEMYFLSVSIVDSLEHKYFKPAELVIPNPTTKDQRWYIKFYVFDVQAQKTVRKRFYDLPLGASLEHRKYLANRLCDNINKELISGKVLDRYEGIREEAIITNKNSLYSGNVSTDIAISKVLDFKSFKELRTKQTYSSIVENLKKFIISDFPYLPIVDFDILHCRSMMKWLESQNKSPRTINNHILTLRTLWGEAIDLRYCQFNPWKKIPRLKTPLGKNIAYLPNQVTEIFEYAALHEPEMEFLMKIMYYTLARTNEIAHMQVKHIGMYVPNKIYIESSVSKNDIERHVAIHPGLELEFTKRNIRSLDPEWYLISKDRLIPGPRKAVTNKLGRRFREWILNPLEYPKEYTLYGLKHTGIIAAHKAGVSDDDIMKQTGHKDYGSFQKYMKSLGLFENDDFINKLPTI